MCGIPGIGMRACGWIEVGNIEERGGSEGSSSFGGIKGKLCKGKVVVLRVILSSLSLLLSSSSSGCDVGSIDGVIGVRGFFQAFVEVPSSLQCSL